MALTHWPASSVCTIDDVLSSDECAALIARSEAVGYDAAPLATAGGAQMLRERNNARVMIDDIDQAAALWSRLRHVFPTRFEEQWQATGINERLRFYRYEGGQRFDWHSDGIFRRTADEQSHFTLMVYLNHGFEGGETLFRYLPEYGGEDLVITPKAGMALLFHHPICHKGEMVRSGVKYVLRSDVMYQRIFG
jgi:predicted 2-oxoglutarate/Fe(II)-dependent dioxygenase YbiX